MSQAEPLDQLVPDESAGSVQAPQRILGLGFGALHLNKDPRRFAVRRKHDLAHRSQPNARIAQLALDQSPYLLTHSIGHALAAVLYITILHKECWGRDTR
jgi:hypothetical protein